MMNGNMLLADDDTEVLAALSAVFASEDYDVVIAKNGREAIERMRERRFDIALLDLNVPVKGGWDAFDRLKSIPPVVADYRNNRAAGSIPAGRCRGSRRTDGKASRLASVAAHD
jgi:CheY-like chemotaxis protein